jgi:hypothetical protein
MSVVNDAIKDGICVGGVSDESVTFVYGELSWC